MIYEIIKSWNIPPMAEPRTEFNLLMSDSYGESGWKAILEQPCKGAYKVLNHCFVMLVCSPKHLDHVKETLIK